MNCNPLSEVLVVVERMMALKEEKLKLYRELQSLVGVYSNGHHE